MNIRNIPDELHKALKIQAAKEGTTMEQLIRHALTAYLDKPRKEEKEGER
jgi:plasmid stability protein